MARRITTIAGCCLIVQAVAWPPRAVASAKQAIGTNGAPIAVRPETLLRGGAVLTAPDAPADCVRRGVPIAAAGGVVVGIGSCSTLSPPGGWVQLERVFDAPYPSTVLVLRVAPPPGAQHAIQAVRRGARARILLDGRSIWEARAVSDDGGGRYLATVEPEILTTLVIKRRSAHALRFEAEPGVAWAIGSIELAARPSPRSLRGIAYSPYRDCQTPSSANQPSATDVDEDLFRILHTSNAVRTYSAIGMNAEIVSAATRLGHPVYAGAWLDRLAGDDAEIHALVELARTSRPAGLIVGNEFYLRHRGEGRVAVDYLLRRIRSVKAALPARHAPVMTADVDGVMFQWACEGGMVKVMDVTPEYRPILDETDAVLVHIYPFWDGHPIAGAASLAAAHYVAIRDFVARRYPGKRVILGETGWPSAGSRVGGAVPGPEAQRRYMAEFMQLADALQIDYFYFDAFDEGWKVEEPGHVGQHWGYADSTRAAKYDIFGALIPGAMLAARVPAPSSAAAGGPASEPLCGSAAASLPAESAATDGGRSEDQTCKADVVYSDWLRDDSKFAPTGWIGDVENTRLYECDRSGPHGGEMAIRADFAPDGKNGWAGVVWQDPTSNWGKHAGGCDLHPFHRLSFWAKGAKGGEVVEFRVGGIGTDSDPYRDTIRPARSSGPVILSGDWQPVTIDLTGADRSRVIGGFSWIASRCDNPQPIAFFIDDIRFEPAARAAAGPPALLRKPFYVYDDDASGCGHYAPSGFMGDVADLTLNPRSTDAPFKGRTAIQVVYRRSARPANHWTGVYWQEPAGNWATVKAGFDLSWATTLTFHARGRRGGEAVEFFAGGLGTPNDHYPDSARKRTTGVVHLTKQWQRYAIDLRGQDLTRIAGGFGFALTVSDNPEGAEFFLDEIAYEQR